MSADLHIHTTISDGSDTPEQVVEQALNVGLTTIAITDHDIIEGGLRARQAAVGKNIDVLLGVEISCYLGEAEVHVLGYFNQVNNSVLDTTLKNMREFRLKRAQMIINKLKKMGIGITWQRVKELAGEGTVGRPHIADALVEQGYIANRESAFKKYIGYGGPAYVPRKKISPDEAIKLICAARGVAVLAHPGTINIPYSLQSFVSSGLKGIEVWHPHHTLLQTQHYLNLAHQWDLIPTGGSDYHGSRHASCNRLGAAVTPMESIKKIKKLLDIP